jgi:uncharacterized protein
LDVNGPNYHLAIIEFLFYNTRNRFPHPKGDITMHEHPIVHIEFSANDREAAAQFYHEVFGWEVQHMPEMNYSTFMCDDKLGGGFNPISEETPAGTVMVYIQVDDFEATLAEIEARGGKTIIPKTEIPTVGWFAFFADPTGNQVALYKGMPQS